MLSTKGFQIGDKVKLDLDKLPNIYNSYVDTYEITKIIVANHQRAAHVVLKGFGGMDKACLIKVR